MGRIYYVSYRVFYGVTVNEGVYFIVVVIIITVIIIRTASQVWYNTESILRSRRV